MTKARNSLLAVGAAVAGTIAADRVAARRWSKNPDPLHGLPAALPQSSGTVRAVEMDDGAHINTVTIGQGPTVVLVHGLSGNRDHWGPIASPLLAQGFQIVAVEHRGHGDSIAGADGFGVERLAADLATVYQELGLTDTVLVGHSMGGMAAMVLAVLHPKLTRERVNHCVLISTAGSMKIWHRQLGTKFANAAVFDNMPKGASMRLGARLVAFGRKPSLHMIDEAIKSTSKMSGDNFAGAAAGLGSHDVIDLLHHVEIPTLIICGTEDRITPVSDSRELVAAIPGSRLELIDGAGHMVIFEQAERLAELIAACG